MVSDMKKSLKKILSLVVVSTMFTELALAHPVGTFAKSKLISENTGVSSESVDERVNRIIAGMTTEQKLAQMMIVSLRSGGKNTTVITKAYEKVFKKCTEIIDRINQN